MQPETARRFDTEFAPRIAQAIAAFFADHVLTDVVPYGGHGHPTRVQIRSAPHEHVSGFEHPLNLELTWDTDEIERLMEPDGPRRFEHYLAALPKNWAHGRARATSISCRARRPTRSCGSAASTSKAECRRRAMRPGDTLGRPRPGAVGPAGPLIAASTLPHGCARNRQPGARTTTHLLPP